MRKDIGDRSGVPAITAKNAAQFNRVITNLLADIVEKDNPPKEGISPMSAVLKF